MPGFATGMATAALRPMAFDITDTPSEAVDVPAGPFDTRMLKTAVVIFGLRSESEVWLNGAVPIWGIVKTRATDGKHRMALQCIEHEPLLLHRALLPRALKPPEARSHRLDL
jgi:hypothetical protein